jgi:hypothetical protein
MMEMRKLPYRICRYVASGNCSNPSSSAAWVQGSHGYTSVLLAFSGGSSGQAREEVWRLGASVYG